MASTVSATAGREFEMSVEVDGDDLIFRIRGDFDLSAAPVVLAAVEAAADMATSAGLVFDLTQVRFLDSAGIDLLVRAAMLQETAGKTIVVRHPTPAVRQMLERMRLTNLIPVEAELVQ